MEMKKIALCTLFTGFNYGSSLQAFAMKRIISSFGYEPILLKESGSLVKGRDFRIKKLLSISMRVIFHPLETKRSLISYFHSYKKSISQEKKDAFFAFTNSYLSPVFLSAKEITHLAKTDDYFAFICGSDQVWNSTSIYIDPFYFLRYCDKSKRIAFAVSFGKDYISPINVKKMREYIDGFDYVSVRERSGVELIKTLCNKEAINVLDPTFLIDKHEWRQKFNLVESGKKTVVIYFLSKPSGLAISFINSLSTLLANHVFILLSDEDYFFNKFSHISKAGPVSFLNYIYDASIVVTDSFHGVAFSINLNKEFYVFERDYGGGEKQNDRISSVLNIFNLQDRFNCSGIANETINYELVNHVLKKERDKAISFLENAFLQIKNGKNE